jgi:hypothetical protein
MWFPQSSTPLCINKKGESQGCTFVSTLQLGVQRGASIAGMPNVPRKFVDGPINMAPLKNFKNL